MRRKSLIVLLLAASLAAGCTSIARTGKTPTGAVIGENEIITDYLAMLDRLGRGGAAEQAEILQDARAAYLADATSQHRLRYAFVLAVPGHAASDAEGARTLLDEALATPETLLPSERAFAGLMVRELNARLALTVENTALRSGDNTTEREHIAGLNRRLQQETAEKERLRRELEEAQAKLEAITALEGGKPPHKP